MEFDNSATAKIVTGRAARFAKQFVSHWGRHAGEVVEDNTGTTITFSATEQWPASSVRLEVLPYTLVITAFANGEAVLRKNRESITEHLQRFSQDSESLVIEWN